MLTYLLLLNIPIPRDTRARLYFPFSVVLFLAFGLCVGVEVEDVLWWR